MPNPPPNGPLRRWELATLAVLAAVPRLLIPGGSSMWLDEILETLQVQGGLFQTLEALRHDAVHPPLEALLSWLQVHLGVPEVGRRLLPIALGVATVVLLADWAAARFGRAAGWATGFLAALSPVHVHYSQELRPYALGLFFTVLACRRYDALGREPTRRHVLQLWLACLGCLYSFYFAAAVFAPLLALGAGEAVGGPPEERAAARRRLRWAPLFLGTLLLALLPWGFAVAATGGRPIELPATEWDAGLAGRRWQFFTAGGLETTELGWGGWLALGLFLLGAVRAGRSVAGRAVLAGVLAGTVGVELLLQLTDHWNSARYFLPAWPFLTVTLALGVTAPAAWLDRWKPGIRLATIIPVTLLAVFAVAQLHGIALLHRHGRPDWHRLARAADALHRAGEPILAANGWTATSLGYYLEQVAERRGRRLPRPVSVDGDPARAVAAWPADRCALLAVGGYPSTPELARQLRHWPTPQEVRIGELRLVLLGPREAGAAGCPRRHLPRALRRPPPPFVGWPLGPPEESLLLDFDPATTADDLLYGWSAFERRADGTTFAWAVGRHAGLGLHLDRPRPLRLRATLWPYPLPGRRQRLTAELNGRRLGTVPLDRGRQTIEVELPASAWRAGENRLDLTFADATAPADVDPGSADRRRLAVAFDRLELTEVAE
jgi:hypothetical protein